MAAAYTILGKKVPSHVLSILTLGSVAGVVAWPRGSKNAPDAPKAATEPVTKVSEDNFDLEKLIADLSKEESK